MKRILLDTNAYTAFKNGHPDVIDILQHADIIGFSVIVLGELIAGFNHGSKYRKNLTELNAFLSSPRIAIFPIDATTTSFYAQLYANLRHKGKPIPTNDLWIAASVLQHGAKICTFDKHFGFIENIMIATSLEEFLL